MKCEIIGFPIYILNSIHEIFFISFQNTMTNFRLNKPIIFNLV